MQDKIPHLLEQHIGGHNHASCVLAVDFVQVGGNPGFNFKKAFDKELWRQKCGRCGVWI